MTGDLDFHAGTKWDVSAADQAHQRADARDDAANFSRLHWYGVSDAGATSNFRHAWYDGGSYINVTAASGAVTFSGQLTATQFNGALSGNATTATTASNSNALNGYASSTSATANTIVRRDANNYIYGSYFNSNRGNETSAAASYIYDSGDGWMRKKTLANAQAEIVTSSAVTSGLGYTPWGSSNLTKSLTYTTLGSITMTTGSVTMSISPSNGLDSIITVEIEAFNNAGPATWTGPLNAISTTATYKNSLWLSTTKYGDFYRNAAGTEIYFSSAPANTVYSAKVYELKVD
jgi:hypothetical protein